MHFACQGFCTWSIDATKCVMMFFLSAVIQSERFFLLNWPCVSFLAQVCIDVIRALALLELDDRFCGVNGVLLKPNRSDGIYDTVFTLLRRETVVGLLDCTAVAAVAWLRVYFFEGVRVCNMFPCVLRCLSLRGLKIMVHVVNGFHSQFLVCWEKKCWCASRTTVRELSKLISTGYCFRWKREGFGELNIGTFIS